jgi:hypothetical protein
MYRSGKHSSFIFELLDSNISLETGNPEIFRCIFQPHQLNIRILTSEVLTAVSMKNIIFWDVTPCTQVLIKGAPDDGHKTFLQNVGKHTSDYIVLYPRRYAMTTSFQFIIQQSFCHLLLHNLN